MMGDSEMQNEDGGFGDEDDAGVRSSGLDGALNGVEDGDFAIQDPFATFAGARACNYLCAVVQHLLAVECAFSAGDALNDKAGILIN